jgi:hypothetical protein
MEAAVHPTSIDDKLEPVDVIIVLAAGAISPTSNAEINVLIAVKAIPNIKPDLKALPGFNPKINPIINMIKGKNTAAPRFTI